MTANICTDRFEEYVLAFEDAWATGIPRQPPNLADATPERFDPLYVPVLAELIRIDLEYRWQLGQVRRLEEYRAEFPEIFSEPEFLREIAFEEYRLRRQAGQDAIPGEYRDRFAIQTDDWPVLSTSNDEGLIGTQPNASTELPMNSSWVVTRRRSRRGLDFSSTSQSIAPRVIDNHNDQVSSWFASYSANPDHPNLFANLYQSDAQAAKKWAKSLAELPSAGAEFVGFQLLEELGRGAFGKVFLAKQGELANRLVALKVSTDIQSESQTLAQLQHTHIVPIYSLHRAGDVQAVCMPYLGSTTLADVFHGLRGRDSLPVSGREFVTTVNARKDSTIRRQLESSPNASVSRCAIEPQVVNQITDPNRSADRLLKMFEGFTYVEAVLWIGARLADGLAHAHDRGILHRDLKPANILLTDEGQPMLLDFNLSADTKLRSNPAIAAIGGTVPYMSPEHLEAFQGGSRPVDERSDVYSLGVILYELLTGQHPFPMYAGGPQVFLPMMIADRFALPPNLCPRNPEISPAVDSIVRHCLQPNPQKRYQRAADLREDLERQLQNLPLAHAADPSWRERARKWRLRHPRLASSVSLGSIAAVLLAVVIAISIVAVNLSQTIAAKEFFAAFQQQVGTARVKLYSREQSIEHLDAGLALCEQSLAGYAVIDNPSWEQESSARHLSEEDQRQLRDDIGELLFLGAKAAFEKAKGIAESADQERPRRLLDQALRWNSLAYTHAEQQFPRALREQRADVVRRLGQPEEADHLLRETSATPLDSPRDCYLLGHWYVQQGRLRDAVPLLEKATLEDPRSFSAWFVRGNCLDGLGQFDKAAECFSACVALRPELAYVWHNRGLVYYKLKYFRQALADFDQALSLKPDLTDALIDRALVKEALNDFNGAIADLNGALEHGTRKTRVYFMRAIAKEMAGDAEGAKQDRALGLQAKPVDDVSWIARAEARMDSDAEGALADIEKALALNPFSIEATQNKAHILAELLKRPDDALKVLSSLASNHPDYVPAIAGRGVLLARLGQRDKAIDDAKAALLRDTKAPNLYQVGCIYALTSRQNPSDRLQAFHLLWSALRTGFGLDFVDQDSDLDSIRNDPEFKSLLASAKAIHSKNRHFTKR